MIPKFDTNYNSLMPRHFDSLGVLSDVISDFDFSIFRKTLDVNKPEHNYMYWYHKDHLGSSTQISDYRERVIHHIEYMPSGEQFSEQRDSWSTPYKFNGKELDAETGLYYYGARYYTPEIGIWLSVDPLSDKYPSLSPYAYCANNPVMLVDPDGREIDVTELYRKEKGQYVHAKQVEAFEAFAKTKGGKNELSKYAKKGQTISGITFNKDGEYHNKGVDVSFTGKSGLDSEHYDGQAGADVVDGRLKISIITNDSKDVGQGVKTICHELFIHGKQFIDDFSDNKKLDKSHAYKELQNHAKKIGRFNDAYIHHYQELNVNRNMEKLALPVLKEYYNKSGQPKSNSQIKQMMKFVP